MGKPIASQTRFVFILIVSIIVAGGFPLGGSAQTPSPQPSPPIDEGLPPPPVPDIIAKKIKARSFEEEWGLFNHAKQTILDALNSKCLTAAMRDNAISEADTYFWQFDVWIGSHDDWAGWFKPHNGNLKHLISRLKQSKLCAEPASAPPANGAAPPLEQGSSPPGESGTCLTQRDKDRMTALQAQITSMKGKIAGLESQKRTLHVEVSDKEEQVKELEGEISSPNNPHTWEGEPIELRELQRRATEAKLELRQLELKEERLDQDYNAETNELKKLEGELQSLQKKEECPGDRHSSKGGSLNDLLGHVSIGIGVDGHGEQRHGEDRRDEKSHGDHDKKEHGDKWDKSKDEEKNHDNISHEKDHRDHDDDQATPPE